MPSFARRLASPLALVAAVALAAACSPRSPGFTPTDGGMDGAAADARDGGAGPDAARDDGVRPDVVTKDASRPDARPEAGPDVRPDEGTPDAAPDVVAPADGGAACADRNIGSSIGPGVAMGTTVGAMDHGDGSCGGEKSGDVRISFTAPTAGTYVIDTVGSDYDTVLYVRDATCTGTELGCNDDTKDLQSEVTVTLTAGQTVVIVVDGYSGDEGSYVLNIRRGP